MKNYLLRPIWMLFSMLSFSILFLQCKQSTEATENESEISKVELTYDNSIIKWRKNRFKELTKDQSWTSLVGLKWLAEGENKFGSAKVNKVVFPEKAPPIIGSIFKEGDSVYTKIADNLPVRVKDSIIIETVLKSDISENPTVLKYESFIWQIIERDNKQGVRIWDTLNVNRTSIGSLKYYEIAEKWNIQAKYVKYDEPKVVPFYNVLAMAVEQKIEGKLVFSMGKETYELDVLNGGENDFFVIFADTTTGDATYGGGRYLYVPHPDESGNTFIDFNKAYTPPCGFTDFATCLLPPAQNRLDLVVDAGEKYVGEH